MPNPSHLECVAPIANGKCRSKQSFNNDLKKEKYTSVHIHGDSSFAGQGIVYETLQMSKLLNYDVGGSLHIVANNQIGFTTTPKDARSTLFSTDIGKAFDIPIIHVNADDPIAVNFCFELAAEYKHKFKKDIIIDVIGYRKHGHNELDQPMFTQPLMYTIVNEKKDVLNTFEIEILKNKNLAISEVSK